MKVPLSMRSNLRMRSNDGKCDFDGLKVVVSMDGIYGVLSMHCLTML